MNPDEIIWSQDYLLKWDDFQGIPKNKRKNNMDMKANTNSGFNFEFHTKLITGNTKNKFQIKKIVITAFFNKTKSWVKKDKLIHGRESILLKHEQGHFDLTASFVSEAKQRIKKSVKNKSYTIKKNSEDLEKIADDQSIKVTKSIVNEIIHDWKLLQDRYDEETNHSVKKEMQKVWNEKFAKLRQ